ncbi:MAG: glucosaminidase domain-containing protein [Deltaproteobacteria bacterium]|nr:glucosaminidase domain-containing protein [Deltaproteobacteria bacterium]
MPRGYTFEDKAAFIKKIYKDVLKVSKKSGFPVEFILAQAVYETGWGELVISGSNNLFNIKADSSWKGSKKKSSTTEFVYTGDEASPIKVEDKFRAYGSYTESIDGWLDFLQSNPRYHGVGVNSKGQQFVDIFDPVIKGDPALLAYALWYDGFATDPHYAETLISIMRGPTMKKILEKIKKEETENNNSFYNRSHSGETLKRDDSDYRIVHRIEPDGSNRGYFISP